MDGLVNKRMLRENGKLRMIAGYGVSVYQGDDTFHECYVSMLPELQRIDQENWGSIKFVFLKPCCVVYYLTEQSEFGIVVDDRCTRDEFQFSTTIGTTAYELTCKLARHKVKVDSIRQHDRSGVGNAEFLMASYGTTVFTDGYEIMATFGASGRLSIPIPDDYLSCALLSPQRLRIVAGSRIREYHLQYELVGETEVPCRIVQQCHKNVLCEDGSVWKIEISYGTIGYTLVAKQVDQCATCPQSFGKPCKQAAIGLFWL
jgi:hypothetical protein